MLLYAKSPKEQSKLPWQKMYDALLDALSKTKVMSDSLGYLSDNRGEFNREQISAR